MVAPGDEQVQLKINEYEDRVSQTLQPDLEKAIAERRILKQQKQDYLDLERNIQLLKDQVCCHHAFVGLDCVSGTVNPSPGTCVQFK